MDLSDNGKFRKLYVGNLDVTVNEELLIALFGQLGTVKGCKIIHEPNSDPYAFIEFEDPHVAAAALSSMNKRLCLGKEMKVNWATTTGYQVKPEVSPNRSNQGNYHIFVGDLAPEIESQQLRDAFAPFGEISDVKIMRFPDTHKPKGYGFVSFANRTDAENAISSMNGQWLGTRKIRTNWATRKVQPGQDNYKYKEPTRKLTYEEVWTWTSDTNTSVYCGGILENPGVLQSNAEEVLRSIFGQYGQIVEIRAFKDKGFGFIKFNSKESACAAICAVHGIDFNGSIAKCGWGRDDGSVSSGNINSIAAAALFNAAAASLVPDYNAANNGASNQAGLAVQYQNADLMNRDINFQAMSHMLPSNFDDYSQDPNAQFSNWWNEIHNAWNAGTNPQQLEPKQPPMIQNQHPWQDNSNWQHQAQALAGYTAMVPQLRQQMMQPYQQSQYPIMRDQQPYTGVMPIQPKSEELRLVNPEGIPGWNEGNIPRMPFS
ncbi:hypothetical protein GJ496_003527 [Pomphorhynchus laevis]|nr:hypothetical protein GJ496_003527 [Pomphorhynchus laevis]